MSSVRIAYPAALLLVAASVPTLSQAQGLGVDVGGVSVGVDAGNGASVSVGAGGSDGPSVSVDAGGSNGASVSVGTGGSGPSVSVDAGGEGANVSVGAGGNSVSAGGNAAAPATSAPRQLEQEVALDAVRSARALPLEKILANAGSVGGEVIDARLVTLEGFLLYELKVLKPSGDVINLYYYARSGQPVRAQ